MTPSEQKKLRETCLALLSSGHFPPDEYITLTSWAAAVIYHALAVESAVTKVARK